MNVTHAALRHINQICAPGSYFRISVQAGGCSGFAHDFSITTHGNFMDATSYDLLQNATLDYVTNLSGSQFTLTIPEATSSCGCGKSFSLF
jgi:Fe-S cluster assembly iron-binding protein IscA